MKKRFTIYACLLSMTMLFFTSCQWLEDNTEPQPTPTKDLMEGVWKVTEAYDTAGNDILDQISLPAVFFQLNTDNGINSTSGPMISRIVYGDSKWTEVQSKITQCFDYSELSFTTGEFFVAQGVAPRFTLEMKLRGIAGTQIFSDLLSLFGAGTSNLAQSTDQTIYHRFMDVKVDFEENDERMIWTFDDSTSTRYNVKDQYGDPILWNGWTLPFYPGRYVLEKQLNSLTDLVSDAYSNQ